MDETHVVTCFLRNGPDVLLVRRSDDVGSYPGKWGAVAGHAEGDPDAAAREEIAEETGLPFDAVSLVRRGDPFSVEDADRGTRWVVHPYLFDVDRRDVRPNWEASAVDWVPPTEILRRPTVPDLWASYRAVAPDVAFVRDDAEHGSSYLSLRALEVLRDRAAEIAADAADGEFADVAALAGDLLDARPSMAALRNRTNRAMAEAADEGTAAAVERAAQDGINRALAADADAAANAAARVEGRRIATISRSDTVVDALRDGGPTGVLVAESRPLCEGTDVAEDLAAAGLDVTLATDAGAAALVRDVDLVLVGADSVLSDGAVVNKTGTRALALSAAREGVPVFAVCATDKVSPNADASLEEGDPDPVYDGDASLAVRNPTFDVTPADLVEGVITERGMVTDGGVSDVAADLRALAGWRG